MYTAAPSNCPWQSNAQSSLAILYVSSPFWLVRVRACSYESCASQYAPPLSFRLPRPPVPAMDQLDHTALPLEPPSSAVFTFRSTHYKSFMLCVLLHHNFKSCSSTSKTKFRQNATKRTYSISNGAFRATEETSINICCCYSPNGASIVSRTGFPLSSFCLRDRLLPLAFSSIKSLKTEFPC